MNSRFIIFVSIVCGFIILLCSMGQFSIPFVVGTILAYAFNVPVDTASRKFHIPRGITSGICIFLLIALFSFFTVVIGPIIKDCFILLVKKLPLIIESIPGIIKFICEKLHIPGEITSENLAASYSSEIASALPEYILNFLNTGVTLIYSAVFIIMTPIITFYLLKDWDKINQSFHNMIDNNPKHDIFLRVIQKININLLAYLKGQLIICFILAVLYTTSLYFIGIKEYIACGILSGFLSFAPFFGPFLGFITSITVSIDEFETLSQYIITGCVYLVIPFIDSNFITPKLIGSRTGIKPFWILFSICAATSAFGTIGVFIAVPLAVFCSTIIKEISRI